MFSRILMVLITLVLTACNGSSGKNDTKTGETPTATVISVALTDANGSNKQSFDNNEVVVVNATILDQSNQPLAGVKVDFATTLGELSPASKLTNSQGVASVQITNSTSAIGAGNIDVTTDTLSASTTYEFIDNQAVANLPKLAVSLRLDGQLVNQFKADQTAQISAQLTTNDGQALVNKIVSFTAEKGQLAADSALTNSQGIASVSITGGNADIGAGRITASYALSENSSVNQQINYQILAQDAVISDNDIRIGYIDEQNGFTEGQIQLSIANSTISAGGTLGLAVDLVDSQNQLITTPTAVNFTSNCVTSNHATIDNTVFTVNGRASATFDDIDCAGLTGTDDVLIATVSVNGTNKTASAVVHINGEQLGSIEFLSASPENIVLKGTGGQGKQETATLTFKVKSALGNAVAQQAVDFSLNTDVGGISLSPAQGLTNSQGEVSVQVAAGTVPTSVRVTASASMMVNNQPQTVQTQSDLLSINTGLPEQRSITIAADKLNPEAGDYNGEKVSLTAYLADNFNNPVPDGTVVNFTTEGGQIQPSCTTVNGQCSVEWTSAEPRVSDHRITVLATALGHESFFDTNGNNSFDDQDGNAITSNGVSSGLTRMSAQPSGFIDMSEAWRDDNENQSFDTGETFIDFDQNGLFSTADGKFNGPQCSGTNCASANSTNVRKALVLVMSGSEAKLALTNNVGTLIQDQNGNGTGLTSLSDGNSLPLHLTFSDLADQTLPEGTSISVSLSAGELNGVTSYTVPSNNKAGGGAIDFVISNPVGGISESATLTITATTPKQVATNIVLNFTLL